MHYAAMLEQAEGFVADPEKIISGGPMMGNALTSLDIPVTKTSSGLLAMLKDDVAKSQETACIRCGRCVEVCPMNLVPKKLHDAVRRKDYERFEELHGMECYACGSCTYVCPAKKPLTQLCVEGRQAVREMKQKKN